MALSQGATVTDSGGGRFNTTKTKAPKKASSPAPKPEPRLEPAPKAPPPPDDGSKVLAEKIEAAGKASVMMMAELKDEIARIQLQTPEVIMEWDFDFERDDKGYLTRIRATANPSKKTLN